MAMGGSQLNAIALAAAVRSRGHEVAIVGQPGALQSNLEALDLEFIELPRPGRRPSLPTVRLLKELVRRRAIDVVHGYEWPPALEALLACSGAAARPAATVMSMSVAPFIPRHLPLMVGTEQILQAERAFGRHFVRLLEPPVDTTEGSSDLELETTRMARQWGIHRRGLTLTIVSRLAHEMKLEGILSAIEVVGAWGGSQQLQLLIVGSGPAHEVVAAAAERVNATVGERRIVMTGEVVDPRWAYAIADVALGMGGSALRAMAMGKPLIVQGENGFWRTLDETSVKGFLWHGWYGAGPGKQYGVNLLKGELRPLIENGQLRKQLGHFSRRLACDRFSLEQAADKQIEFYDQVVNRLPQTGTLNASTLQGAFRLLGYEFNRAGECLRGTVAADDFNAQPLAGRSNAGGAVGQ
jgi:glycosyltransferase involved in cell wall biosynthesis